MPRPPDSTALTAQDADAVRDLVAQLKAETGITTPQMADRIEADPDRFDSAVRQIDNAMSRSRRLLARKAVLLLRAVNPGRDHPDAQQKLNTFLHEQRLKNGWLARYDWSELRPSVFIPKHEIARFAAYLANEVGGSLSARQRFANRLAVVLRKEAGKMAWTWRTNSIGITMLPTFDRLFKERRDVAAAASDRLLKKAHEIATLTGAKKPRPVDPQSLDRHACIESLVLFEFPEKREGPWP